MAPDAAAAAEAAQTGDLAERVVAFCAGSPALGPALGAGIQATPLSGGYINGGKHAGGGGAGWWTC